MRKGGDAMTSKKPTGQGGRSMDSADSDANSHGQETRTDEGSLAAKVAPAVLVDGIYTRKQLQASLGVTHETITDLVTCGLRVYHTSTDRGRHLIDSLDFRDFMRQKAESEGQRNSFDSSEWTSLQEGKTAIREAKRKAPARRKKKS
jgi:hypothetical protein